MEQITKSRILEIERNFLLLSTKINVKLTRTGMACVCWHYFKNIEEKKRRRSKKKKNEVG